MLTQCKDAIDNPAALFARMRRRELSVWRAIRANNTSWKIWTLADIRAASTNQELALAVTSLRAEAENPKQKMEDKVIVDVCGYPELYIHLRTFTKTGIHFATRLELPGRSPSHDAYSRMLCNVTEFHARMKRVNSKCSSIQLARIARFSRVWCERTLTRLSTDSARAQVLMIKGYIKKELFTERFFRAPKTIRHRFSIPVLKR